MAVRAIRLGGDEILRKPSREITAIDAHVRALVRDMEDTLRAAPNGAAGEMAKCFCHELDHLDGIVFLDRAAATLSV